MGAPSLVGATGIDWEVVAISMKALQGTGYPLVLIRFHDEWKKLLSLHLPPTSIVWFKQKSYRVQKGISLHGYEKML